MRHEFVGDDRDLFKWSLILDLAEPDKTIVYVPMARPDERLRSASDPHLRDDVKQYFRENRMNTVEAMCPSRMSVASWDCYANETREAYFDDVCRLLDRDASGTPRVVFLDPDTGMEPRRSSAKHVHVRDASLKAVWRSMRSDDILVVYQHAPLSKKDRLDRREKSSICQCDWGGISVCRIATKIGCMYSTGQRDRPR